MSKPTDIELSVGLSPKDVKDSAKELGKSIEDIFNKTAGNNLDSKMQKLQQQMSQTTAKAQGLINKMTQLESKRIPTDEYKAIQKQIEKTEAKLAALREQEEKFAKTGRKISPQKLQEMQYNAAQLENTLEYAKSELQELVNAGKAFTLGSDTQEYEKLSNQLGQVNNQSRILINNWDNMADSEGNVANKSKVLSTIWKGMLDTFKRIGNAAKKLVSHLFQMATSFKLAGKNHKGFDASLKKGIMTVLKYGFGIRSLYFLFRKLRTAVADGIKAVVQWEGENGKLNKSISSLMSAVSTLKNNIGAMVVPIINSLAPAITNIINLISDAIQKISMFIAAFTGQKTYLVANKVQENFAASLDKTAKNAKKAKDALKGYLSPLDEINKYQEKDKDTDSGSGGGGATFKEVPIDSAMLDFVNQLKEMWKNKDFYNLGKMIGEKLRDTLESIPWDKIRQTSNDLGKAVASLINGFIEVERLAYDIGYTVAQGVNTVFEFINGFVHELHWDSIGEFIADTFNGFFETIDWPLIKDTVVTGLRGIAEAINSFIENFHWENISNFISNAVNTITAGIYEFFSTVKWDELGAKLGEQLMETIRKINWEDVGRAIGSVVQAGLDFFKNFIAQLKWDEIKTKIGELVTGFFEEVNKEDLANLIKGIVTFAIGVGVVRALPEILQMKLWSKILASTIGGTVVETSSGGVAFAAAGTTLGTSIAAALVAAFVGYEVGNKLVGPWLHPDEKELYEQFTWFKGKDSFFNTIFNEDPEILKDAWHNMWHDMGENVKEAWRVLNEEAGYANEENKRKAEELTASWGTADEKLNKLKDDIKNGYVPSMEEMKNMAKRATDSHSDYKKVLEELKAGVEKAHPEFDKLRDGMKDVGYWGKQSNKTLEEISAGIQIYSNNGRDAAKASEELEKKYSTLTSQAKLFFDQLGKGNEDYVQLADNINKYTVQVNNNEKATEGMISVYQTAGSEAENLSGHIVTIHTSTGEVIETIPEFNSSLQTAQTEMKNTGDTAKDTGDDIVKGIQEPIKKATFGDTVKAFFESLWKSLKEKFGIASPAKEMKPIGNYILEGIVEGFTEKFDNFKQKITDFYNNTVKPWFDKNKWTFSGVGQGLQDTFEQAKNLVKTPINAILGFVEKLVNGVIDGFNNMGDVLGSLDIDIPDWVPEIGGKSFEFNIPKINHISIPRLAQGAVIPPNKEFLAMLGDQKSGVNIETPLATMLEAFRQVLRENNGNGVNNSTVIKIVSPDNVTLAQAVIEGGKVIQMSSGNNPFELAGG